MFRNSLPVNGSARPVVHLRVARGGRFQSGGAALL